MRRRWSRRVRCLDVLESRFIKVPGEFSQLLPPSSVGKVTPLSGRPTSHALAPDTVAAQAAVAWLSPRDAGDRLGASGARGLQGRDGAPVHPAHVGVAGDQ